MGKTSSWTYKPGANSATTLPKLSSSTDRRTPDKIQDGPFPSENQGVQGRGQIYEAIVHKYVSRVNLSEDAEIRRLAAIRALKARLTRFELVTSGFVDQRSIQLSYRRMRN